MADVKLRQVRSANGASPKQRGTLASLKLGRIGRESTMNDTPQLRGALDRRRLAWGQARVQAGGPDPELPEGLDLVLHERDQG